MPGVGAALLPLPVLHGDLWGAGRQEEEEEGAEAGGGASVEERYEERCKQVENSAEWGGQLELGALAGALQRRITVFSVGMPPVHMGPAAGQPTGVQGLFMLSGAPCLMLIPRG